MMTRIISFLISLGLHFSALILIFGIPVVIKPQEKSTEAYTRVDLISLNKYDALISSAPETMLDEFVPTLEISELETPSEPVNRGESFKSFNSFSPLKSSSVSQLIQNHFPDKKNDIQKKYLHLEKPKTIEIDIFNEPKSALNQVNTNNPQKLGSVISTISYRSSFQPSVLYTPINSMENDQPTSAPNNNKPKTSKSVDSHPTVDVVSNPKPSTEYKEDTKLLYLTNYQLDKQLDFAEPLAIDTVRQGKEVLTLWTVAIEKAILENLIYPRSAQNRSISGKVILKLEVKADGTLLGVKIKSSSGFSILDSAAKEAVLKSGRLPAAPKKLDEDTFIFNLPVSFRT